MCFLLQDGLFPLGSTDPVLVSVRATGVPMNRTTRGDRSSTSWGTGHPCISPLGTVSVFP